jgi:hypothetical protein
MKIRSKQRRRQLTWREKAFLKHRAAGLTLAKAAIAAGYSVNSAKQAGAQAMDRIAEKVPELFARHGLDDDSYIDKHVLPLLHATEIKVFHHGKRILYSKPLAALSIQARIVELIAELKGMKVKEKEKPGPGIKVLIVNEAHRPRNRTAPPLALSPQNGSEGSGEGTRGGGTQAEDPAMDHVAR